MLSELGMLLDRDVDGLRAQVERYPDDESLWRNVPGCPNSGGTLALHAVGNLRHYIGAVLGGTGYVRDREAEFSSRNVPANTIIALIAEARDEVGKTLAAIDPKVIATDYPDPVAGRTFATGLWLLHLATHLAYHLGQIDYHRRMVTGDHTSAGTVSVRGLEAAA